MIKLERGRRSGFTLIELLIVIAVIAILAAIAIPNLLSSREAANEASAIGSVRTINSAEATYRTRNGVYGTLANLGTGNLIDPSLAAATNSATPKSGFYFSVVPVTGTTYYAVATQAPSGGARVFYTDESGVIYGAVAGTTAPSADTSGVAPAAAWSQIGN